MGWYGLIKIDEYNLTYITSAYAFSVGAAITVIFIVKNFNALWVDLCGVLGW